MAARDRNAPSRTTDELDELEDEDSYDEGNQDDDELDAEEEKVTKEADATEAQPVSQKEDADVDELANARLSRIGASG